MLFNMRGASIKVNLHESTSSSYVACTKISSGLMDGGHKAAQLGKKSAKGSETLAFSSSLCVVPIGNDFGRM